MDDLVVERVAAAVTFPLRQQVLRPHQTVAEMALPGDDDPRSGHFAASLGGQVVGTASVRPEAAPWDPDAHPAWRLRGMATDPRFRSRGVGSAVLVAVVEHVGRHGGGLLWCNARVPAAAFYGRHGFAVRGAPWEEPHIGPHVQMWQTIRERVGRPLPWPADRAQDGPAAPPATTPPR